MSATYIQNLDWVSILCKDRPLFIEIIKFCLLKRLFFKLKLSTTYLAVVVFNENVKSFFFIRSTKTSLSILV